MRPGPSSRVERALTPAANILPSSRRDRPLWQHELDRYGNRARTSMMLRELTIHRGSPFTVRRQIELQIESRILARDLDAGARLPSIRRLAGWLDVHRNTVAAAYRALGGRGLVIARHGSGVFVGSEQSPPCARPRAVRSAEPVVVAREAALARLLASEVTLLSGQNVTSASLSDLPRLTGRHVLTTAVCRPELTALPEPHRPARITCLSVDPLHHLRPMILSLRVPAVMAVLSSSARVRELVAAGVWRLRGDSIAVRPLGDPDSEEARRTLSIADLALADPALIVRARSGRRRGHLPTVPILLISFRDARFRGLGNLLGPDT